jgi:ribose 1,5-bisphosphokinase PhnN
VSTDEFAELEEHDQFFYVNHSSDGHAYGWPASSLVELLNGGFQPLILARRSGLAVKTVAPKLATIYVEASYSTLQQRLILRGDSRPRSPAKYRMELASLRKSYDRDIAEGCPCVWLVNDRHASPVATTVVDRALRFAQRVTSG